MFTLANFIRRRFKMKDRKLSDTLPKIEGTKDTKDWIAIDLGNIALHIFTGKAREDVDLETLWTVGPQYDDLTNKKESDIVQLLSLFGGSGTVPSKDKPKKK
jgi:ribosomal silencing factor RsfS